jgi:osmotically-inducible protein OsmY
MSMRPTAALLVALALSIYGPAVCAQATAPATGQAAKDALAPTDEALTKAVSSALEADPHYYFRHVTVRVEKGVAKLSGYVDSGAAIQRARTVAGKVPGVTRVETNHLKVDTQLRR